MPKEYIKDEQYRQTWESEDGQTGGIVTTTQAKITWGRDTYVQIAVVTDEDQDGMEANHLSLNRSGINAMIRTLRKARDQAYGRDE